MGDGLGVDIASHMLCIGAEGKGGGGQEAQSESRRKMHGVESVIDLNLRSNQEKLLVRDRFAFDKKPTESTR